MLFGVHFMVVNGQTLNSYLAIWSLLVTFAEHPHVGRHHEVGEHCVEDLAQHVLDGLKSSSKNTSSS